MDAEISHIYYASNSKYGILKGLLKLLIKANVCESLHNKAWTK